MIGSQQSAKFRVVTISPTGTGGQPDYVFHYLTAVSRAGKSLGLNIELLTGKDLEERFRTTDYLIHDILPEDPDYCNQRILPRAVTWYGLEIFRDNFCLSWLDNNPGVDAVHFQEFDNLTTNLQLWRFKRRVKKLFLTVHNILPHKYPPAIPHSLITINTKISYRQFDTLFVHTEKLKYELIEFLGHCHPAIEVIPHGIFSPPSVLSKNSLENRLNLKKALFFGNIRANKGLHIALAAMTTLTDFELTIAGRPFDSTYWNETIVPVVSSLRNSGVKVETIAEFIPESSLGELFDRHSFVILPYTRVFQAQSGVLYMAIALNTPVVVSNVGGLGEIVSEWGLGEVADPENPEQFADAIRKLYSRDSRQLERNLDVASRRLSWDEAGRVTVNSYLTQLASC